MKTEIAFTAAAAQIHFAYDGAKVLLIIPNVPIGTQHGIAIELMPHEFVELADGLNGLANSIRPDAQRHYHAIIRDDNMKHTLKHAKELGKSIQEGADPDAGEPWKKSLGPDHPETT